MRPTPSSAAAALAVAVLLLALGIDSAEASRPGRIIHPCQWSSGCFDHGRCSPAPGGEPGRCVVGSDADCRHARACRENGQCRFLAGGCAVGVDDDGPADGESERAYQARLDEHCAPTPACRDYGACSYVYDREGKRCDATAQGCRRSVLCRYAGLCGLGKTAATRAAEVDLAAPSCGLAAADAQAKTPACEREGLCGGDRPERARICAGSAVCRQDGRCGARYDDPRLPTADSFDDSPCVPQSAEHCRVSDGCKLWGRCTYERTASCVADTDAECKKSTACKRYGACKLFEHACVVTAEPAHCPNGTRIVTPSAVAASSVHAPMAPSEKFPEGYAFGTDNLFDDDPRTSWQPETGARGGVGAHLTFTFPEPVALARIDVANGFLRADSLGDLFLANNRVREAVLRSGDEVVELLTLDPYHRGLFAFHLDGKARSEVRLEVLSVHRGWQWNDLALSQVRFHACL